MTLREDIERMRQMGMDTRERVLNGEYPVPVTRQAQPRARDFIRHRKEQLPPLDGVGLMMEGVNKVRPQVPQATSPQSPNDYIQQQKEKRDAFDPKNPVLKFLKDNTVDLAAEGMDRFLVNTSPGRFINRVSQAGGKAVGVDTQTAGAAPLLSTGSKGADVTSDVIGTIAGSLTDPSNVTTNLVTGPIRIAQAAVDKFAPKLGKYGRLAAEGSISGAVQGGVVSGVRGETDAGEMAKNVAIGAAVGTIADPLVGALGPVVSSAVRKVFRRNGRPESQVEEILALPEPRPRGNPNRAATEDVITTADARAPGPLALPEPRIAPPTRARIQRAVNPYREQFESLIEKAKELEAEGKLSPGREDQDLESLWSQMAGREAPSLNELIDLAYPTPKMFPDIRQAREYQAARQVAGAPMPVKSMADRYATGPINNAAAPITVAARAGSRTGAGSGRKTDPFQNITAEPIKTEPDPPPFEKAPGMTDKEYDDKLRALGWDLNDIPFVDVPPPPKNIGDPDVLDNIFIPEPDAIAPRVRDRLTSYADQMIASAKAERAKGMNRLNSNPVGIYYQMAREGAGYMLKGAVKLADFSEIMIKEFGEGIKPHIRAIFKQSKEFYAQAQKQIESEELGIVGFEAQKLKDLSNINLNTADVYRNFRKVFGEHYPAVKKAILDPFDRAKGDYAREQKALTDRLQKEVVQRWGIRRGSKDSALVQRYGEGEINLDQLRSASPNWKNILEADKWFREEYKQLIKRVNQSIASIYPNNPDKLVPERKDYYRHFQELKAWSGLQNLFDTSSKIDPSLSGISPQTKPKTKWASFKQKRGLGEFTNDAVGGFLDYVPAASYAIHIDPHISSFRNLAKRLAEDTANTKNLNNFISFLNRFSDDISGKTSSFDRWLPDLLGRKSLEVVVQANNRIKSNVILGNVRSTLSQLANIPNGIAFGGVDAPAGAVRTIQNILHPTPEMANSNFLTERYLDKSFRQFRTKWWEQPKKAAEAMMELSDRIGTTFIWNTAYVKAIRQNIKNPVQFADEQTRRLVGGRGIGEQPLLIKSKLFNVLSPFQLEVNNLWRVMKEFVDEKEFGSLATLLVANFLLNKAFEKLTGSGVVFDPIDALYDAITEEEISGLQRGGRVAGEVLSNFLGGQTIARLYPEYGRNVFGVDLPTRKALFGDQDPTRFGSGILAADSVSEPFRWLLPWGGNQLRKTIQGVDALARGGSYTENFATTGLEIEKPALRFPVESKSVDVARGVLFGPYATSSGQEYIKEKRRPLSEAQTRAWQNSPDPDQTYEAIMNTRAYQREVQKMRDRLRKEAQKNRE